MTITVWYNICNTWFLGIRISTCYVFVCFINKDVPIHFVDSLVAAISVTETDSVRTSSYVCIPLTISRTYIATCMCSEANRVCTNTGGLH